MDSFSDAALISLTWWLGWIGVIGAAIGVLSMIGGVIVGRVVADRTDREGKEKAERLAAVEAKHADTERELGETKRLAAELQANQKPRTVSVEQKQRSTDALRGAVTCKVCISSNTTDGEATSYALQIMETLKLAGVQTEPLFQTTEGGKAFITSINEAGLLLIVKDVKAPPPGSLPIARAFVAAGIPLVAMNANSQMSFPEPGAIVIWASRKL